MLDERALRTRAATAASSPSAPARCARRGWSAWLPAGPRRRSQVALVGKGITFDSGGLNIKTANMGWMKSDMGGARRGDRARCCAAAALQLPVEVTATVPMAENMPSGIGYRPSRRADDCAADAPSRSTDTDAEGRLVLADAIARALEDEPDYLIEAVHAHRCAARRARHCASSAPWASRTCATGSSRPPATRPARRCGRCRCPTSCARAWTRRVADLRNLTGDRWGGMLVGGAFLADFVPAGLPWVHLDIAGPAWNPARPARLHAQGRDRRRRAHDHRDADRLALGPRWRY